MPALQGEMEKTCNWRTFIASGLNNTDNGKAAHRAGNDLL